jgi:hypothetical protein
MSPENEYKVYLNRKKYDVIIGIDPDADKSGMAVLDRTDNNSMNATVLPFPELLANIGMVCGQCSRSGLKMCVVVEAGWMEKKSNFHGAQGRRAERIAKDVGRNHETGRKIIEMLDYQGIDNIAMHPLRKIWRGRNGKITHNEILSIIPDFGKKSNQEERDAALLAWHFAELPIVLK